MKRNNNNWLHNTYLCSTLPICPITTGSRVSIHKLIKWERSWKCFFCEVTDQNSTEQGDPKSKVLKENTMNNLPLDLDIMLLTSAPQNHQEIVLGSYFYLIIPSIERLFPCIDSVFVLLTSFLLVFSSVRPDFASFRRYYTQILHGFSQTTPVLCPSSQSWQVFPYIV